MVKNLARNKSRAPHIVLEQICACSKVSRKFFGETLIVFDTQTMVRSEKGWGYFVHVVLEFLLTMKMTFPQLAFDKGGVNVLSIKYLVSCTECLIVYWHHH